MNVWVKRSLSTAAVAGGLFFAGAAAAHADTGTAHDEGLLGGKASAPIEIGSIDLGVQSSSSSSHSSTVSHTGKQGTTTSTKQSTKSTKDSIGLSTGKITADPAATLKSVTRSTTHRSDGAVSGKQSQHTQGSVQAPVSIGGVKLTGQHEETSTSAEKVTRSDKHGTSVSERRTVRGSKTGGSLETGSITLNPNGSLDTRQVAGGSADRRGNSSIFSHSATDAAGSLPISFGGLKAQGWSDTYSLDYSKQKSTGKHGSRTEERSDERATHTGAGVEVGRLVADPQAELSDRRSFLGQTDRHGRYTLISDQATTGSLSAPFRFDGVSGFVTSQQASRTVRATEVANQHRTVRKIVTDESASSQTIAGHSGAVTGDPSLDFADHRSSLIAGDRHSSIVRRDHDGYAAYAFPYSYDGFGVAGDFANASRHSVIDQVADRHGVTTRTETDQKANRTLPAYNFQGFHGSPEGVVDFSRISQLTQLDK
ncbi:hypothetical protein ACIA49_29795 [Kribbella sp. NPDC051587]|uniref:hypothetical protein n=1 Tax=Kribbella sp. NPDC051587 TaxID=3364119 RepID=UPI0037B0D2C1